MPPNREAPFLKCVGSIIYMGIVQIALDPPVPPPSVKQVPPLRKKVKIAQDKSAQRTSLYAGSFLIQEGFWLMTFQCVLVIQSSLSLYPKLIDTKNTVLTKLTIVPKSARRTSSYADIV